MAKKKFKKKITSTSKPAPKPKKERFSDNFSERIEPPAIPDPEDEFDESQFSDDSDEIGDMFKDWDKGEKKNPHVAFPPPKKNPVFRQKWQSLIKTIAMRDNFKPIHLFQLEVLCDLLVEYEQLSKFIRQHGYTYTAIGRQGKQIKTYPQVAERNRVKDQIRGYCKMLDLITPKGAGDGKGKDGGEWN